MNRHRAILTLTLTLTLALAVFSWGVANTSEPIVNNPFTRPGYTADRPLPTAMEPRPEIMEPLQLKATLIAGSRTLADINGEILAPGDEIQGHRLIRINEGEAVLRKDGTFLTLSVYDEKKEDSRD